MYIDGEWVDTQESYEIRSSATEELVATVARGDLEHANRAVAAAKAAHEEGTWRRTSPAERSAILQRVTERFAERTDELALLHAKEIGATIRMCEPFHFGGSLGHMQYLAELAGRYEFETGGPNLHPVLAAGKIRREPVGVCAAIVPWNIPRVLSIWKVFPALGAGNTVVIKPDEHAPLMLIELARELEAAGLPRGVFNVITGEGEVVGARGLHHGPRVAGIGDRRARLLRVHRQGPHLDALARRGVLGRVREVEGAVRGEAGAAVSEAFPALDQQHLVRRHPLVEDIQELAEHRRIRLGKEALSFGREVVGKGRLATTSTHTLLADKPVPFKCSQMRPDSVVSQGKRLSKLIDCPSVPS
jgi:hypothetical protein